MTSGSVIQQPLLPVVKAGQLLANMAKFLCNIQLFPKTCSYLSAFHLYQSAFMLWFPTGHREGGGPLLKILAVWMRIRGFVDDEHKQDTLKNVHL